MSDEARIVAPLAYRGKAGCRDVRCSRHPVATAKGMCFGWHCSYCDQPCSSQGHGCDAANAIIGAARAIADEDRT